MNVTGGGVTWLIGAMIGLVLNGYMMRIAIRDLRYAMSDAERALVRADIVQWGAGALIKFVGLMLGIWVLLLPPEDQLPVHWWELWASEWGRQMLLGGLNSMMFGMDIRDSILIYLRSRSRKMARREFVEPEHIRAEIIRLQTMLDSGKEFA